ncbi:hypothetical protein B0H17DRAFT_957040, partial [Mycena rosella]
RMVQRALIEGGLGAKIQLAYKIYQANGKSSSNLHCKSLIKISGVTASGDATSLRGHNYESSHVMITKNGTHKNCILSINSTVNHTSETQVDNWRKQITQISEIFKHCPFSLQCGFLFELSDFLRLL